MFGRSGFPEREPPRKLVRATALRVMKRGRRLGACLVATRDAFIVGDKAEPPGSGVVRLEANCSSALAANDDHGGRSLLDLDPGFLHVADRLARAKRTWPRHGGRLPLSTVE